jgi:hypothetical protein
VRRQSRSAHAALWQREPREEHASCICPYIGVGVVSWTRGIQVSTRCNEGRQRTLSMRLRAHASVHVSSASGAGGARLHR